MFDIDQGETGTRERESVWVYLGCIRGLISFTFLLLVNPLPSGEAGEKKYINDCTSQRWIRLSAIPSHH